MKKILISTFSAIALALPLAVGGVTLTAPVSATDAEANIFARARHHFNTCSRDVIWKCHGRVQSAILFNGNYNQLFPSRAMPERANGLDQATFGTLEWQYTNNWGPAQGTFAGDYLREFFSDADVEAYNEGKSRDERFRYTNDGLSLSGPGSGIRVGYIRPDERAEFDRRVAREEEQRRLEEARRREREEEQRVFNILNSRDRERITRHFCAESGSGARYLYLIHSGRHVCEFSRVDTDKSYYERHFGRSREGSLNDLRPELVQQYQIGVPLGNLLRRFQGDCEYHNGEYKPAPADNPVIKNPTCGVVIGQTDDEENPQNIYRVTEYTGWDYTRPNVYTRRHGDLNVPVDVSYADYEDDGTTGLQVDQVTPVTTADLAAGDEGLTREVISRNRETIIDLVENVNRNDNRVMVLEPMVASNTAVIQNLGNSLAAVASEVASLRDNVEENRAGVALSLAIPRGGLKYDEKFRLSAGVGTFKGESALGVGVEFAISPRISASVGGGFSEQGSGGGRAEISYGW